MKNCGNAMSFVNLSGGKPPTKKEVLARIQNYLEVGGLFNPELMEHDKVRDLIIDCREHLLLEGTED